MNEEWIGGSKRAGRERGERGYKIIDRNTASRSERNGTIGKETEQTTTRREHNTSAREVKQERQ